uniref:Uncharacterized protein n=1 Tax=Arundo donax TaxID=35708 RepID=A0A0A9ASY7_ARUDO
MSDIEKWPHEKKRFLLELDIVSAFYSYVSIFNSNLVGGSE